MYATYQMVYRARPDSVDYVDEQMDQENEQYKGNHFGLLLRYWWCRVRVEGREDQEERRKDRTTRLNRGRQIRVTVACNLQNSHSDGLCASSELTVSQAQEIRSFIAHKDKNCEVDGK